MTACGPTFDTQKCGSLTEAIAALESSPLDMCRWMGERARKRLEAGQYRYDPNFSKYGYMTVGQSHVTLGPASFSPIGVSPNLLGILQVQNTVAHEEAHFIFGTTHSFERSVRHSAFGVPDQTRWDIPSVLGAPDQIGEACRAGRVFN